MSEKNRIEKVIQYLEMTSGQFAAEIGVQNSTLSHILNNRNNPSLEVLKKILSRFTEISADWLILGQGSMLRFEKQSKEPTLFDSMDENSSLSDNSVSGNVPKNASLTGSIRDEMLKNIATAPGNVSEHQTALSNRLQQSAGEQQPPKNMESVPKAIRLPDNFSPEHTGIKSDRKVTKVILYFTDNTFQEFESK
ncbi:MAG: hypothetical protein BGP01_10290 [Paludibacter sp. 47-17]|nr:MAG: hypothetical protein BGP01_10290 [Paludibacter sp. 47-17]